MKLILLLFLFNCSLFANQFYTFDLNSNLIDSYQLSDELYLIEGDMKSCLLYNSTTEEYREIYTNHKGKITSVELLRDILYIGTGKDLTVLNINNNSFIKDSAMNSSVTEIFDFNNKVYITRNSGIIDEITINYVDQTIIYSRVDSLSAVVSKIESDGKLYLLTSDESIYEFDGALTFIKKIEIETNPDKIVNINNKIYFLYRYQYEVFSEEFEFIERISLNTQSYAIVNEGYYTCTLSGNNVILNKYDAEKKLLETNENEIDKYLNIDNINSIFITQDKIIVVGDKKLIIEFDKTKKEFLNHSAIKLTKRLELGDISFANKRIGAYTTDESFLYITENGGVTWKNIDKTEEMEKINFEFNFVKYFDSTSFIAFSNPYKGTFITNDNGKTYKNINNPSNGSAYAIPYLNKFENKIIFSNTYNGVGAGYGLSISIYDEEYQRLNSTFLDGFFIIEAAMIEDKLNILVWEKVTSWIQKYSIIRTDTEMSYIEHDTSLYNYERVFGLESIDNSYYIVARSKGESDKQYLLKADKNMTEIDTIKVLDDKFYYEMFSNNNKLFIKDSTQRLYYYNEKDNELEQMIALNDTVKFRMNVEIFDDVIFSSYKDALLKSVKIPEFSEITDVKVEALPSFYLYNAYPNPAKSNISVLLDYDQSLNFNDVKLEYFDITGANISNNIDYKINKNGTFGLEVNSNISKLKHGVYFIQFKFGNKIETVPFVVE